MEENRKLNYDAFSRVIAVYGAEAMVKLMETKVFLQGLRGVGIETAKNLILAGPHSVVLHDDEIVTINDLGSNFYCQPEHVGKVSRAEASLAQLSELNQNVKVTVRKGPIDNDFLKDFNVVVLTNFFNRDKLIEINDFCHKSNIGFIYTGELGLYGFVFVDFGTNHSVFDQNGEESKNYVI